MFSNTLGIPIYIIFFDEDFYIENTSQFDTPENQKYFYDNAQLKLVLSPFLSSVAVNNNFKFVNF